jgi:hypothetical protein
MSALLLYFFAAVCRVYVPGRIITLYFTFVPLHHVTTAFCNKPSRSENAAVHIVQIY